LFLPIVLAELTLSALIHDVLVDGLGLEVLDGEAGGELDGILNLPALVVEALQVNDEDAGRLLDGKALFCVSLNVPAGCTLVLVVAQEVLRAAKIVKAFFEGVVADPLVIRLLSLRNVHGDATEVFIGAGGLHAVEALDLTSTLAAKNLE